MNKFKEGERVIYRENKHKTYLRNFVIIGVDIWGLNIRYSGHYEYLLEGKWLTAPFEGLTEDYFSSQKTTIELINEMEI